MRDQFLFVILIFCFTFPVSAQLGVQWANPIPLSGTGDKSPSVGLLDNGTVVVVWGQGSSIYIARKFGNGFTPPAIVPTGGITPDIYSFGGVDMAVKGNEVHIVFEDYSTGIHYVKSSDGGVTFGQPVNFFDPPAGKWATLASIEVDDNFNPMISFIYENSNETNGFYYVFNSSDGGLTFDGPATANIPSNGDFVCECCLSDFLTSGSDTWLIFRNNDNNLRDMWVTKSTDGGDSFTSAVDVDDTDWVLNACPISGPRMAPLSGDSIATVWNSGAFGPGAVYVSTFNSATMDKGIEISIPKTNPNSNQTNPWIAGANDTLGIVWEENGFGANGTDILFSFSETGASGLTSNIVNITDRLGNQKLPRLIYNDGMFHLVSSLGNNTLEYRSGTITAASGISTLNRRLEIQLLEQPILNNRISFLIPNHSSEIAVSLISIEGRLIQEWKDVKVDSQSKVILNSKNIPAGLYILSVQSAEGNWSGKVYNVE